MQEPVFHIEIEPMHNRPGVQVLRVRGKVLFDHAPALRERLLAEVARTQASTLVVDLGSVEKMSSAGAAVLVEGLIASRERGLHMLLWAPSESVVQTFQIAGLDNALEACCRREEIDQKMQNIAN
jgi:anti-anti-sigma factor